MGVLVAGGAPGRLLVSQGDQGQESLITSLRGHQGCPETDQVHVLYTMFWK